MNKIYLNGNMYVSKDTLVDAMVNTIAPEVPFKDTLFVHRNESEIVDVIQKIAVAIDSLTGKSIEMHKDLSRAYLKWRYSGLV